MSYWSVIVSNYSTKTYNISCCIIIFVDNISEGGEHARNGVLGDWVIGRIGWLGDWVIGWLGDWVIGILGDWVDWVIGWLGDWVIGWLGYWVIGWIGWLGDWVIGILGDWVIGWIGWLGDWVIGWLGYWVDWVIGWLGDWDIGWLGDFTHINTKRLITSTDSNYTILSTDIFRVMILLNTTNCCTNLLMSFNSSLYWVFRCVETKYLTQTNLT